MIKDANFNIAIITSRFNEEITSRLTQSGLDRLKYLEFKESQITAVTVPGAIEIPLIAQQLAKTNTYEAIVCYGCVIRGETSHYDYVCDQVSQGCLRVSLDYDIPIIFGVLTTEDEEQAIARSGGNHSDKGVECIDAAIEMVKLIRNFR